MKVVELKNINNKQERTISEACILTHFVSQMFNSFQWPRRSDPM